MTFSLRLNNDLPFAELAEIATAAEEGGFDQLWVSNDLFLRSAPALAGALATRTERLRLGIAVMNPYSVHVSELAMAAATLQEVTGGRFLLGVGAGSEQFLGWAGIDRPRPLDTTATAVVTLRALLGHSDVDEALLPEWYGRDSVLRFELPAPVPVYVGGMGPRMLRMAGEHADGVLPLLYPPEHYAAARGHVLAGRGGQGRPFDFPACFWVSVGPDRASARAALAQKLAYYGPSISPHLLATAGLRPEDFAAAAELAQRGEPAAAEVDDRMLSLGIAGGVADVIERCQGLRALGADHLSFGPPLGPDVMQAVRLLGAEVLPALPLRSLEAPA